MLSAVYGTVHGTEISPLTVYSNHVLILYIIYVLLYVTVFIVYYFDGHLVQSVLLGIHPRPRHLLQNILGDTVTTDADF